MNNSQSTNDSGEKVSILLGIRDNLLKPMKKEIVDAVEQHHNRQGKLLSVLIVLTILNAIMNLLLLLKN